MPDPIAVAILEACDGTTDITTIADRLAARYRAPIEAVLADCLEMLDDLATKGMIAS
jgi:Coenzyme PQQ synthesis protein D (PqqD).